MSSISYIDCSDDLNLWCSASLDGYINIYTFPLCKLVRCIKVDTKNCLYVFLSSSPLPSIIAICNDNKKNEIFVYSINGYFFKGQEEQGNIYSPIIIKDLNFNDYLAYISKNNVIIRSVPNLFMQVIIDDLIDVYTIVTSEDKKILYALNQSGNEIYVVRGELKRVITKKENNE